MTQYKFFKLDNDVATTCRPDLDICHKVVQECPYYTPARDQLVKGDFREILYGGLPAFMCPPEGKYFVE